MHREAGTGRKSDHAQPIGIDARQRLDEQRFAVIDVARRSNNHSAISSSWSSPPGVTSDEAHTPYLAPEESP